MFLGHYGVAFALKRAEPKVSLGSLFVAVQLADVLWGCFLLLGWEQVRIDPTAGPVAPLEFVHYPISHSLVGSMRTCSQPSRRKQPHSTSASCTATKSVPSDTLGSARLSANATP